MLVDDKFFESVSDDPSEAILNVIARVEIELKGDLSPFYQWDDDMYQLLCEGLGLVELIAQTHDIDLDVEFKEPIGEIDSDCSNAASALIDVRNQLELDVRARRAKTYRNKHAHRVLGAFAYEFSEGDLSRLQFLINELRVTITQFEGIEDGHRRRLLARLEKLQSELHKRVSDLDRFWGMVGDAGVALGKFGDDAKPIVDRIKEMAGIAWRTQARAEELPSDTENPMLAGPADA